MQPFDQGFRDMSPAVDKVEQHVAERKLRHGGNPILNMCAAGAVVQSDPAGNRKLHKSKSYSKIDGLVALAMALGSMSAEDMTMPTSPWDDPEFKMAV
jgi:phage terminase large subunit-like protein